MAFKKGNKFGKGRPKGSLNKRSTELRAQLHDWIEEEAGDFDEAMLKLKKSNPEEYVKRYISLLPFVLPKLANIELTGENGEALQIKVGIKKEE